MSLIPIIVFVVSATALPFLYFRARKLREDSLAALHNISPSTDKRPETADLNRTIDDEAVTSARRELERVAEAQLELIEARRGLERLIEEARREAEHNKEKLQELVEDTPAFTWGSDPDSQGYERSKKRGTERLAPQKSRPGKSQARHFVFMQVALSLLLTVACLFVVLSKLYDANSQHWAFGTLGLVMGFWLKGAK